MFIQFGDSRDVLINSNHIICFVQEKRPESNFMIEMHTADYEYNRSEEFETIEESNQRLEFLNKALNKNDDQK